MKIAYFGYDEGKIIDFLRSKGKTFESNPSQPIEIEDLERFNPDILISYGYRKIIPLEVIKKFPKIINLHISLLPWNRGISPNFFSWLENTPKGYSIHYLNNGIDTGKILLQKEEKILENETLASSYSKLKEGIEKLFIKNWRDLSLENISARDQKFKGTYHSLKDDENFKFLLKEKGWDTPVKEIKEYGMKNNLWKQ
jgi:methionyl-tRNA formyltransferase